MQERQRKAEDMKKMLVKVPTLNLQRNGSLGGGEGSNSQRQKNQGNVQTTESVIGKLSKNKFLEMVLQRRLDDKQRRIYKMNRDSSEYLI